MALFSRFLTTLLPIICVSRTGSSINVIILDEDGGAYQKWRYGVIFKAYKMVIRREKGSTFFEILVTAFMDALNTLLITIEALKIPSKTLILGLKF